MHVFFFFELIDISLIILIRDGLILVEFLKCKEHYIGVNSESAQMSHIFY